MQAYVNIGANCEFRLSEAVLVYRAGGGGASASLHRVKQTDDEAPFLAPGEPLTTAFVRALAQGLGAQVKPEVLPESVLARTPDMLVWWSRPQRRVIFFGGDGLVQLRAGLEAAIDYPDDVHETDSMSGSTLDQVIALLFGIDAHIPPGPYLPGGGDRCHRQGPRTPASRASSTQCFARNAPVSRRCTAPQGTGWRAQSAWKAFPCVSLTPRG